MKRGKKKWKKKIEKDWRIKEKKQKRKGKERYEQAQEGDWIYNPENYDGGVRVTLSTTDRGRNEKY